MGDASLDFGFGDSQYVFTDRELNELLGVIEQKAAGAEADLEVLDFFRKEEPLALQFQPRSHKDSGLDASLPVIKQEELPMSALSSALASPVETPALQQSAAEQPFLSSAAAEISILPMPTAAALQAFALPGTGGLVGAGAGAGVSPFMHVLAQQAPQPPAPQPPAPAVASLAAPAPQPPTLAQLLPSPTPATSSAVVMPRFPSVPVPSKACTVNGPELKGQISHSTVEKQRRDRINSLIDELRELVPPQQRSNNSGAEGLEARRPKHVVLADTIQLLKHLQHKLQVTTHENGYPQQVGAPGGRVGVGMGDDDTANSEGKSKSSSHEDVEMGGAPQMPHIPCQMTQNAGVTVERGPDCYYVQVKCRDRKGLLSDIINALRQLPLEIRTAAVTTTNGTVRDVFEVKLDDPGLSPEDVQNLVHDALFQQPLLVPAAYEAMTKRPRA
ncbi:hypothetical protein GPECTOR_106g135 [Gonium pectorale]|uniref:BHLH domain-containing protein n=1 Tax=Gonium pectorale TaxID=33097 RepID=A0A150FZK3_GONPE|nr:hypothetical protein GPECTOR_106g135 [Gonium pectorale]|eukprot:KXZ43041.1 hypothetical protein GPECTOR_106g135 [Gonium pectorale]